jgi:uncharacterized protein
MTARKARSSDRALRQVDLEIESDGLVLGGGACLPAAPRAAVLLLHGIPSTAPPDPEDQGYPGVAREFAGRGFLTGWVDMRAARGAPGVFSIEGWVHDARSTLQTLRSLEEVADLPAAIVGSSAGGSVAVEVARRGAPVDALALLAAPANWRSFAEVPEEGVRRITEESGMSLAPSVREDPGPWADEFERVTAERSIAELEIPVLVVHGTADDVVPVEHARRIGAGGRYAEVEIVPGGQHQLRRDPQVITLVLDWLDRRLG